MIGAIGPSGFARPVDTLRADAAASTTPQRPAPEKAESAVTNPVAALVAEGAPVDTDKVARLRAAIAEGRYAINPQAIADRMLALDLPARA